MRDVDTGEITRLLRRAVDAVEDAGVPEDLRGRAFERALDAVGLTADSGQATAPASRAAGDRLERIAAELRLPLDQISLAYEERGGGVRLAIPRMRLPNPGSKAAAMRDVALLVAVGRQAAGLEEQTPYAVLRSECEELAVLDAANFAAEVAKLGMTRGARGARVVKAGRHHRDEATRILRGIVASMEP